MHQICNNVGGKQIDKTGIKTRTQRKYLPLVLVQCSLTVRSLQQHPEVNEATRKRWSDWGRQNINLFILQLHSQDNICKRDTRYLCMFFLVLSPPCIPPRSDRVPDMCTRNFPPLLCPKVTDRGGETAALKSGILLSCFGAVRHCVLLICEASTCSWTSWVQLVRFRPVFFFSTGHGCCRKCQGFFFQRWGGRAIQTCRKQSFLPLTW